MKQVITDIESNLQKGDSDLSKGINVGLKTAVALIIRGMKGKVIVPVELTDPMIGRALRVAQEQICRVGPDTIEDMYKAILEDTNAQ